VARTRSELLSIAEVSELLGIPAPTLRSWERRYGFPTPPRTLGQHRRYSRQEIELLRALRDEIARGRAARDAVETVRRFGAQRVGSDREDIDSFVDAAVAMDVMTLQRILNGHQRRQGVERTIIDLALPALREIGIRWESKRCTVGHEHLATEQISHWLHRQRASLTGRSGAQDAGPAIVIGCGPDDLHRVGADAFAVLMGQRRVAVTVLGSQVPPDDMVSAVEATGAGAVVVASHMKSTRRSAVATLRRLRSGTRAHLFFAGNGFITSSARKGVPGTYLGEDMLAAADLVAERLTAEAS
jgi:MerR family transcriptional regulator, light-induced transcriptional regulator